ncbi:DUF6317 family protein [Actinomadura sp. NPDC000600]|uniref:DUF6317 family protein n=1 Tax=Actinomadura sp. NPDC000600 TaxID=3154262 RepID=UPI003392A1A4
MTEVQVVFKDLLAASKAFHVHGKEFGDIVPKAGPPAPHVNEPTLQLVLPKVLQAIGAMHDAVAASMEAHSVKLRRAHDVYLASELKNRDLIERLAQALANPDAIQ